MTYIKKIIASVCLLFASASALSALDKGSFIFYPEAGLGLSGGFATALNSDGASRFVGSNTALFKRPQEKPGFSWNIGCGVGYAFTDLLTATSGLFIDKSTHKIVYKKIGSTKK